MYKLILLGAGEPFYGLVRPGFIGERKRRSTACRRPFEIISLSVRYMLYFLFTESHKNSVYNSRRNGVAMGSGDKKLETE